MLPITTSTKKHPTFRNRITSLYRLPRKHVRRIRKELAIFAVLFIVLSALLRYLHRGGALHFNAVHVSSETKPIVPRFTLDDLNEIPRNMYYLKKEPVMYCYIPKNACSALKPIIRKREGFVDWSDPRMVHGKRNGLQRLLWLQRGEAMSRLEDTSLYRFVVVRNPFARLVSAYQNKVAAPWPDQRYDFWNIHLRRECPSLIESRTIPETGPLLSLEDFLHCLNAPDTILPSNEHWRPQTELCGLDNIKYNRYIFLENFSEGVKELLNDLKWDEDLSQFNIERKPVYENDLDSFFTDEAVALALKYYKNDFELLGYEKEPQGKIGFFSVYNGTNFHPDFAPPIDYKPPTQNSTEVGE